MSEAPTNHGFPIARTGRWVLISWAAFLVAGFGVSIWLQPDQRGFGTHEQFRWAPCSFQQLTGWHCPSCGMTTSFSHFIRGHWQSSIRANSTGFFMALFCAFQIPWSLISVKKSRLWLINQPHIALLILLGILYLIAGVEYVYRTQR
jgi:hypothetical protein